MHVTLRQLQVFSAVASHGSFTKAAKELNLTQPAVSMQVKQLEEQIQTPLFEHLGKRIFLTDAGQEVFHTAKVVLQQLDDLGAVLDEMMGLERGRLRIAAISTANYFVPRLLGTFCKRHEGVNVALDVTNRTAVLNQLAENVADMAVMGTPPSDTELEAAPFMDNPVVIVAPPDHPLAEVKDIPLKRLEEETFLIREPGSGTRNAMKRFFDEHGLKLNTGMEMSSQVAIKQSIEAGLGLGMIQKDAIEMELRLGRLVILDVADTPVQRHWYLVHRKGKRLSAAAQAFKDFVLGEAADLLKAER